MKQHWITQMQYSQPTIPTAKTLEHPAIKLPSPPITTRGITSATLERYGIINPGQTLTIATPIYKYENLIGWKYRKGGWVNTTEKESWWAAGSERWLIGTQLWTGNSCIVYLCEGETDMLALYQHIPPTDLAVCYGGAPNLKELPSWLDWLDNAAYEVRLCFDSDEQGDKYREQFELYWEGKASVKTLVLNNYKDVAELLLDGGELEWIDFPELPDTLLTAKQVEEKLYQVYESALTTGCSELDTLVDGYRDGKIILLAGMEKQGKSQFMAWLTCNFLRIHHKGVMFFSLELTPQETLARLRNIDNEVGANLYFVDHFGYLEQSVLAKHLKLCKRLGVKLVVIDHITAAATQFGSEGLTTQALDGLMYQLQALANELGLYVLVVSHVNSSCQGVMTTQHLRGSRSLAQVPDVVLGIQILDGGISEVRTVIRDRMAGKMGRVCYRYDNGNYEAIESKEIL